jgi:hypothetical protein
MPSSLHEALIEMFRHRPSLAAELLTDGLGIHLPSYEQARLEPGELNDLTPTEYRADAVVVLTAEKPVLAVVVEAQLRRDATSAGAGRSIWPRYAPECVARPSCWWSASRP